MYIVEALHRTAHGNVSSIVASTEDIEKAIRLARTAESLGYEFHGEENIVVVSEMTMEKVYFKSNYAYHKTPPQDFPILLILEKKNGKWVEKWFNPYVKSQFPRNDLVLA